MTSNLKNNNTNAKSILKKTWNFIWHSESTASLIVNFILAIILVKFIIYPGLSFALGTTHPVVAVISESMYHDSQFDNWYENQNEFYSKFEISKEDFKTFTLKNGFNRGDLVVVSRSSEKNTEIGDIIVFWTSQQYPIIHRIINVSNSNSNLIYQTKGDNNPDSIEIYVDILGNRVSKNTPNAIQYFDESQITEKMIVGKAIFKIPYVGLIKIWVVEGFLKIKSLF